MVVDRYTQTVLTVIAAALLWLCALQGGGPAQAQQRPQPAPDVAAGPPQAVVIVGWGTMDADGRVAVVRTGNRGTTDPNIPVKLNALPRGPVDVRLPPGPVDVRLPYSEAQPLPVGVSQINPAGAWEPVRVAVEDAPVRTRPGRGGQ
jgi:hypothetical protein